MQREAAKKWRPQAVSATAARAGLQKARHQSHAPGIPPHPGYLPIAHTLLYQSSRNSSRSWISAKSMAHHLFAQQPLHIPNSCRELLAHRLLRQITMVVFVAAAPSRTSGNSTQHKSASSVLWNSSSLRSDYGSPRSMPCQFTLLEVMFVAGKGPACGKANAELMSNGASVSHGSYRKTAHMSRSATRPIM